MGIIDFNAEVERLLKIGSIRLPDRVFIAVDDARDIMMRGLRHFLGDGAQWLPEYDKVADWLADNKGLGLFCYGHCGRGKTVLTARVIPAILHYWAGKVVFCYTADEIGKNLDKIKNYPLVCIDDVGTEGVMNTYGNKTYALPVIVDAAERDGHLLILSSNLGLDEIKAKYGERTMDRLREICTPVLFRGDSLRGKGILRPAGGLSPEKR